MGAGFYWKHQGQNESKAGTTVNAPETTINTLTTGLVGHWTFDALDISGTTVTDRGTGGNDGTITGAVPALGKLGQGMGFDGGGDYVCMGDVLAFERTDPFSLSAWVHLATDSDVDGSIIGKMGPTPDQRGYDIYASTASWKANIRNSDSGSNGITVNGLSDIADETWHHIAVTYDGSSSASGVTLYVDGADDTGTTDMDTLSATIVSSADFSMGTRNCTPSPIFDVKGVI
ncbi:MAG: hypothetical protein IPJ67_00130 [Candidatus Moraniibacteriota bacterium]|nr:MAG: hypothetical protein IPJ67_00130 [Candidatus Moranbacteria bacterium]